MIDHRFKADSYRANKNWLGHALGWFALLFAGMLSSCTSGHERHDSIEGRISNLIEVLASSNSERQQQMALIELERYGISGVPYLVAHLGDYRLLYRQKVSLANKDPNAVERVRHYSPETVHDALSAILNQITGVHFSFVYNGSNMQERDNNRRSWLNWCRIKFPDRVTLCGG